MKRTLTIIALGALLAAAAYLLAARIPAVSEQEKTAVSAGPIRLLDKPQELPDFTFVDADNKTLSLRDFRGKVLLLNIWATWCPPCRKEMPALDRLQARLGGQKFMVLPLSTDRNGLVSVKRFYKRAALQSLAVYLDPNDEVTATLQVPGLPTTFLIDQKGRALGVRIGPAEWDSEETAAMIQQQLQVPSE